MAPPALVPAGSNATDLLFPSTAVTVRNPSARLRNLKQTVGHRIAHKRLLGSSSSSCPTTTAQQSTQQQSSRRRQPNNQENEQQKTPSLMNESFSSFTTKPAAAPNKINALAYRRPRNLFYSASRGYYYACTFLDNDSNVVLCIDHCGIDAIRLLDRHDRNNTDGKHETLGRAVATGIHASSSSSSPHQQQIHLQTTSILQGKAFVTGLPSGEYRVFATEHASTWGNQHILQSLKVSQRQQQPPPPLSSAATAAPTFMENQSLFTTAWSVPGPQRRYKPDSVATLLRQARNPSAVFARPMEEIHGWNQDTYSSDHYSLCCPSETVCHWDFRETPSSLLALHVGKYQDNVGLRVLDDRACQNSRNQVGILVDDMPEALTASACCFVTDTIIATAQSGASTPERIRLWDLRKMQQHGKPTKHLMCPSFPREVVHTLDPFQEPIHLQQQQDDEESSLVSASSSSGGGGTRRIVDLKSNHNGRLLVTTAEDIKNSNNLVRRTMQSHWSIDLAARAGETIPLTRPYQIDTSCHNNNLASPSFAYDQSCSVVATYQGNNNNSMNTSSSLGGGGGQPIALYDIANAERIHEEKQQGQQQGRQRPKKRGRRQKDILSTAIKPIGHIDAHVKDEYGLDGKLVSIAMNAAGTAVVGVSRDSDLYWWSA